MANKIKELRLQNNLSLAALEAITGISAQQLNRLEKNERRLNQDNLSIIANALKCSPSELIDGDLEKRVVVLGDVPGGNLMEAIEQPSDHFISFNSKLPNIYALRVKGNSMSRIAPDGAYVIVDVDSKNPDQLVNHPVIICIENHGTYECSFKIYKRNPERFVPFAIEEGYDTIYPENKNWCIFGKVIGSVGYIGEEAKLVSLSKGRI
ncbi:MAG: helix-turn-helix domain-containing protein [Rickettsiales bacterium]